MSTAQFVNTLSCIRKSFGKPWVQSWACWASGGDFNPPTGCRPQDVTMAPAKIWEHLADVKQRDVNRPHGRCWLSSLGGAIAQKVEAIASRLESLGGRRSQNSRASLLEFSSSTLSRAASTFQFAFLSFRLAARFIARLKQRKTSTSFNLKWCACVSL